MQNENQINENLYGENQPKQEPNLFFAFLFLLKRFWFVILASVLLITAAGMVYMQYKKPIYTATEQAMVIARISGETDNNFAVTQLYLPTIKDMGNKGVVLDRADFYYQKYIESSFYQTGDILGFIDEIETINYTTPGEEKHFKVESVGVSYTVENNSTWISVSYSDENKSAVAPKTKILVAALDQELAVKESALEDKYTFLSILIVPWGNTGVVSNMSYNKTVIVCLLVGIIVGIGITYLLSILDRTLKTEEELEEITGINNFALIRLEKGGEHGK